MFDSCQSLQHSSIPSLSEDGPLRGGKWSQAAVFSINSSRNPPTSCTGFSDPSREKQEEVAGEIMFLLDSGYCLPGSDTPPQLTKVLSDPPWSLRRAARGFVSDTLDVYSWSPGSQENFISPPPICVLRTTHPPPLYPRSEARHTLLQRQGVHFSSHTFQEYAGLPLHSCGQQSLGSLNPPLLGHSL